MMKSARHANRSGVYIPNDDNNHTINDNSTGNDVRTPLLDPEEQQAPNNNESTDADKDTAKFGKKRPSVLYGSAMYIIVTEFCERLAYGSLAGSLILFFQRQLHYSNAVADIQYSLWSGICYVMPLAGGYIADTWWGRYKTILVSGPRVDCCVLMSVVCGCVSLCYWLCIYLSRLTSV
jgi:dipeptide/tripeptide permease